jgi:hypothetical protein
MGINQLDLTLADKFAALHKVVDAVVPTTKPKQKVRKSTVRLRWQIQKLHEAADGKEV